MTVSSSRRGRRALRLQKYDYSQPGFYFVTISAQERACVFGELIGDEMALSDAGTMVASAWTALTERFPFVELDEFVVMPNHLHGILVLNSQSPDASPDAKQIRLGDVVGAFKSLTTVQYARGVRGAGWQPFRGRLWQRDFYDHIIRSETSLLRIRRYILDNPTRWAMDRENPEAENLEAKDAWLSTSP